MSSSEEKLRGGEGSWAWLSELAKLAPLPAVFLSCGSFLFWKTSSTTAAWVCIAVAIVFAVLKFRLEHYEGIINRLKGDVETYSNMARKSQENEMRHAEQYRKNLNSVASEKYSRDDDTGGGTGST